MKDATQAAIQRGEERWLGTLSATDRAVFLRVLQELSVRAHRVCTAGMHPALTTRCVVAGVGDRQPVADQRAQRRQHVARAVVQCPGADGRGQLRFVGEAEFGQRLGDLGGGVVGSSRSTMRSTLAATRAWKLTWPASASRLSGSWTRGRRCRGSRRRRRRVRPRSAVRTASSSWPPPSSRSSTSHSVSLTRRPIAANSTDRRLPGQVPLGLEPADDAPAQRGQRQPPPKRVTVDGVTRGRFVGATGSFRHCQARPRRDARARRSATPGCRTRPGPRIPRRCAPVPSPAPPPGRIRRRSGCPSGNPRAPAAAATAAAGAQPASETPTRMWLWCRPFRRAVAATR